MGNGMLKTMEAVKSLIREREKIRKDVDEIKVEYAKVFEVYGAMIEEADAIEAKIKNIVHEVKSDTGKLDLGFGYGVTFKTNTVYDVDVLREHQSDILLTPGIISKLNLKVVRELIEKGKINAEIMPDFVKKEPATPAVEVPKIK